MSAGLARTDSALTGGLLVLLATFGIGTELCAVTATYLLHRSHRTNPERA